MEDWNQTSQILATLINTRANRRRGSRTVRARELNPFLARPKKARPLDPVEVAREAGTKVLRSG